MKFLRYACACVLAGSLEAAAAESTGAIMRDVYDAIAYLLPLSVRDPDGATPWDRPLVDAKLEVLTAAADALVEHAQAQDAEFGLLARSFDRLVRDTAASFRQEWPDYAYYSLLELTDHCVACHSRLPADAQALFGERLMARMNLDALAPEARARLYIATRRFDAALDLFEEQLLDATLDPVEADYRGLMIEYLRVALSTGASGNLDRVKRFIDTYRQRNDLPYYLEHRLDHWRHAATRLTSSVEGTPSLRRATQIFEHSNSVTLAPGNRLRAVEDFIAARLLRQHLVSHPKLAGAELADIYYRLAIVALRTAEPEPAVPELEVLLVATIQADPQGPHARVAYALLEEYGYVQDEHLARQAGSNVLIDMPALRRAIGAAAP
jgi:hypothetical protein